MNKISSLARMGIAHKCFGNPIPQQAYDLIEATEKCVEDFNPPNRLETVAPEMAKLLGEMTVLLKINIRVGYERIIELGGQCDTPETMIKQHKEIALAEELLKSLK